MKIFRTSICQKRQYSVRLLDFEELIKASDFVHEVIDNDPSMLKQGLITEMKIEFKLNDKGGLTEHLLEYLKIGDRSTLDMDKELKTCLNNMSL